MSMDITQSNKLIAEFMGDRIEIRSFGDALPRRDSYYYVSGEKNFYLGLVGGSNIDYLWEREVYKMKYHTSWDWLMPVVEKIESIEFSRDLCDITITWHYDINIQRNYCIIKPDNSFASTVIDKWDFKSYEGKLSGTYQAVVQFILWYNENKKK